MPYCKNCYKEKINPFVEPDKLLYFPEEATCEGCGESAPLVSGEAPANPSPQNTCETESSNLDEEETSMTVAECNCETQKHIETVRRYIRYVTDKLTQRGVDHDASKLVSPEVEVFAKYTNKLATLTFGSDEYDECLKQLQPALVCHYSQNRHHPEHYPNGINDMSLVDIIEMVCDWKAAAERQHDGNILKTIDILADRFNISKQLKQILINTIKQLDDI